jgi:hypothetical protein
MFARLLALPRRAMHYPQTVFKRGPASGLQVKLLAGKNMPEGLDKLKSMACFEQGQHVVYAKVGEDVAEAAGKAMALARSL